MIDCKTGNLIVESHSFDLSTPSDQLEESKTNSKKSQDSSISSNNLLNQTELNGFIEKDESVGKIEVKGFSLSIKGLTTDHEQIINFTLGEWRQLLNLLKLYNEPLKVLIGNYRSSQEEKISKRKLMKVISKYIKKAEHKLNAKIQEFGDVLNQKTISKIIRKVNKDKSEGSRYLFEILLPRVSVSYLHHEIDRNLATEDVEHLCNTNFEGWKLYIIRSLFRMEFNIHDPIPKKYTDKYLAESKNKEKSDKPMPQSEDKSNRPDSKYKNKDIVLKKQEAEQVQKAQKNIAFWFD